MENRYKEFITKEASKYPDVATHAEETNIDSTNLTFQANPNPTKVKMYSKVSVQMTDTPNEDSAVKSTTTMPEGN